MAESKLCFQNYLQLITENYKNSQGLFLRNAFLGQHLFNELAELVI